MMTHGTTFANAQRAKAYLVNRIVEQAMREGTPLNPAETKLLYYSEDERTVGNEVVADFPDDNSDYESKITALLMRCYRHECNQPHGGESKSFLEAIEMLRSGDHYILVMAEPALSPLIPRLLTTTSVSWKQGILVVIGLSALMMIGAWIMGNLLR